ncbi:MAG TPA: hypothetical protein VFG28_14190 [Syntrophales bacterium]|nr:hypothetical protein [Syntrophales bacterium]
MSCINRLGIVLVFLSLLPLTGNALGADTGTGRSGGLYQLSPPGTSQKIPPPPVYKPMPAQPTPSPVPALPANRGALNPKTGEFYPSHGEGVINPRTGEFYPPSGTGYFNPRTGEFYPGNEPGGTMEKKAP